MGKVYPKILNYPFSYPYRDDKVNNNWWKSFSNMSRIVNTEKLDGRNLCLSVRGIQDRSGTMIPLDECITLWNKYYLISEDIGDMEIFVEDLYYLHSIEYLDINTHSFVFAIRDKGKWLSWDIVKFIASYYGMKTVPEINQFKGNSLTEDEYKKQIFSLAHIPSAFVSFEPHTNSVIDMEGIVSRNAEEFDDSEFDMNVIKYRRVDHIQPDTKHWSKNKHRAPLKKERG